MDEEFVEILFEPDDTIEIISERYAVPIYFLKQWNDNSFIPGLTYFLHKGFINNQNISQNSLSNSNNNTGTIQTNDHNQKNDQSNPSLVAPVERYRIQDERLNQSEINNIAQNPFTEHQPFQSYVVPVENTQAIVQSNSISDNLSEIISRISLLQINIQSRAIPNYFIQDGRVSQAEINNGAQNPFNEHQPFHNYVGPIENTQDFARSNSVSENINEIISLVRKLQINHQNQSHAVTDNINTSHMNTDNFDPIDLDYPYFNSNGISKEYVKKMASDCKEKWDNNNNKSPFSASSSFALVLSEALFDDDDKKKSFKYRNKEKCEWLEKVVHSYFPSESAKDQNERWQMARVNIDCQKRKKFTDKRRKKHSISPPRRPIGTIFDVHLKEGLGTPALVLWTTISLMLPVQIHSKKDGKLFLTKGCPPWYYNEEENLFENSLVIGIACAIKSKSIELVVDIIEALEIPWITYINLDSFCKAITFENTELIRKNEFNYKIPELYNFEYLYNVVRDLKAGKSVFSPIYGSDKYHRKKSANPFYASNVIICEGMFTFYNEDIRNLIDLKIFIDPGDGILSSESQEKHLTYAYEKFIKPTKEFANYVINLEDKNETQNNVVCEIANEVKEELKYREIHFGNIASKLHICLPPNFSLITETDEVIKLKNELNSMQASFEFRKEIILRFELLMRKLIDDIWFKPCLKSSEIKVPNGISYYGKSKFTDWDYVFMEREGHLLENSFHVGMCSHYNNLSESSAAIISIETNPDSDIPRFYFRNFAENYRKKVLLLDFSVSTGSCVLMAIKILIAHEILQENIMICALSMKKDGIHRIAYHTWASTPDNFSDFALPIGSKGSPLWLLKVFSWIFLNPLVLPC